MVVESSLGTISFQHSTKMFSSNAAHNYSDNGRVFRPRDGIHPKHITYYNPRLGFTRLSRNDEVIHNSFVLSINGGCTNIGSAGARGSYGVYYGRNSPFNISAPLPTSEKQNKYVAELYAVKRALETWKKYHHDTSSKGRSQMRLVIQIDSEYVKNTFSEYIWKWRDNNYRKSNGDVIQNLGLILYIDSLIGGLMESIGVQVQFWHILRSHNGPANDLATYGLVERPRDYPDEEPIQRPSEAWAYAWNFTMSDEEESRANILLGRMQLPMTTENESLWIDSITSHVIGKWILSDEFNMHHSFATVKRWFGPKYNRILKEELDWLKTEENRVQTLFSEARRRESQSAIDLVKMSEMDCRVIIIGAIIAGLKKIFAKMEPIERSMAMLALKADETV